MRSGFALDRAKGKSIFEPLLFILAARTIFTPPPYLCQGPTGEDSLLIADFGVLPEFWSLGQSNVAVDLGAGHVFPRSVARTHSVKNLTSTQNYIGAYSTLSMS